MIDEYARDVATDEGCVRIVEESVKALGGLDVIISNAVCINIVLRRWAIVNIGNHTGMDENGCLRGSVCSY